MPKDKMSRHNPPKVEDVLKSIDEENRQEEINRVLQMAEQTTNGESNNTRMIGAIRLWQVKMTIQQDELIRTVIEKLGQVQFKEDCVFAHRNKKMRVNVFGVAYTVPISIGIVIIGILVGLALRKAGVI